MSRDSDVGKYMTSYLASLHLMEDEASQFKRNQDNLALSRDERLDAAEGLIDITFQIKLFKGAHEAYLLTISPGVGAPSAEVLKRTMQLSTGLAKEIANAKTTAAIIATVTNVVDAWTKFSGGPVEGGAGAGQAAPGQAAATTTLALSNSKAWASRVDVA